MQHKMETLNSSSYNYQREEYITKAGNMTVILDILSYFTNRYMKICKLITSKVSMKNVSRANIRLTKYALLSLRKGIILNKSLKYNICNDILLMYTERTINTI